MMKPNVLGWAGHVCYGKLVEKSENNKPLIDLRIEGILN
jgi:hypothetical protein